MTNPTYKPFNLQEAIAGKPIIRRDGTPANFLYYSEEIEDAYKFGCLVERNVSQYTSEGKYFAGDDTENEADLFMAPEQETVWINVYRDPNGKVIARVHTSEENSRFAEKSIWAEKGMFGTVLLETIVRTYDKP